MNGTIALATPASAQVPEPVRAPRSAGLPELHEMQQLRGTLVQPLKLPSFEITPMGEVFASRPFTSWVEEREAQRTASLLRAPQRFLLQARLVTATPDEFAQLEAADVSSPVASAEEVAVPTSQDSVSFLPPLVQKRQTENLLGGTLGEHADIGLRMGVEGVLGGAWNRQNPCDPTINFNCNPGMFPELKPDAQFNLLVGGTISERVNVNVDYDQRREFDAANNINVFYQGLPDEILQRIEVGDVSIRLPSSRYLTRGVPSGNFGFMAAAQVGPLELQTVFAEQKGDVTTRRFEFGGGGTTGVEQDAELVMDDADYVKGQFFFIVPPAEIAGSPHIDILSLLSTDAPASVRPGLGGSLQVYRDERATGPGSIGQLGRFLAEALPPGGGARHTGSFQRLNVEEHYYLHPSGLWLMLRSPLRQDEALAISFVTETGDTIGTMNAESAPPGTTPRLLLLRGPVSTHQPGSSTWDMEMHQVYRLDSSSEVDLSRVDLQISVGELSGGRTFRSVLGQDLTFLRFFGLDEESPADRIDAGQVFQPARDGFGGSTGGGGSAIPAAIGGTFVVFPTLRPFAVPAPLQSARVSAEELRTALGTDANDAIYFEPDPVNRDASGRFRLNFRYRVRVDGVQSSFNLGAYGIRENSERLRLGARELVRGIDYEIDYEVGVVTVLDATTLFATAPDAQITATWEQKPLFAIAPRTTAGASARYRLGERGELNFVGLFQREKSLVTRPLLGTESGGAFLGGVGGTFQLGGGLLDRMVGGLGIRSVLKSSVSLTGEVALTSQDPNRIGVAYLDDFESTDEISLRLRAQDWKLGSAPQSTEADRGTLPSVLNAATAVPLVWQDRYMLPNGTLAGPLPTRTWIDNAINVAGSSQEPIEPVMWLTWGFPNNTRPPSYPAPTDPRQWRSLTTVLSPTGIDMTRSEYLEFYVSAFRDEPLALVFDIGNVSEDAFYVDAAGNTTGTRDDGRRWGLGELDAEARLIDREVWGTDRDALGLWDQECQAEPAGTYPLGDPRGNCTRSNGINDSEDLNGNGILDPDDGQYFRYVVQLDENSEYLVRDTVETGTTFRLYRIPLRSGAGVNGASDATWRFIRHMRMTITGEGDTRGVSIARMRIVGSRWTKRDVYGVMAGNLGDEPGAGAAASDVRVGPVSGLTDGLDYIPPPGVRDQLQDRSQQYGREGIEVNEKSLRIAYTALQPDERAEVYFRYPQQPRNLLEYGEVRLWALAREGNWGPEGGERFSVRIGTDPKNFYIYQTRLNPETGPRPANTSDWLPEVVIDTRRWMDLKATAERRLIEGNATGDTLWSADSTYGIVLEDRARAPNLAAVRELVFAVHNGGSVPTDGEVWIDELRLGVPNREPDVAGNIGLNIVAGDLMTASVSWANQGALFRQLNESPSYVQGRDLVVNAETKLGLLLPAAWGVDLPVSVSHSRNGQTPTFLSQTDVLADELTGLRQSGSSSTRIGARIAKRTPTANPLLSLLLDGTQLRVGYNFGDSRGVTQTSENRAFNGDLSYRRSIAPRMLQLPGFFDVLLRVIAPARIEQSDAFRRLTDAQFRWSPATISFGSAYNDQMVRSQRFERILELPGDTGVVFESPRQMLRNDATLGFQPFSPLSLGFTMSSDRDMLDIDRATTREIEQAALRGEVWAPAGVDLGWETTRALTTTVNYRPEITDWLRGSYTFNNRYLTDRNPSYISISLDSVATLQRRFESTRQTTRTLQVLPKTLVSSLGVDTTQFTGRALAGSLRRVSVIDFTWRDALTSAFDRESFTPGRMYQLGLGGPDAFRIIGGDTAARAQQRGEFRASTALELMKGVQFNTAYTADQVQTWDARGGSRTVRRVGWPSANVSFREVTIPRRLQSIVSAFEFTLGFEANEASTLISGTDQTRSERSTAFPISTRIGLQRGFSLSYRGRLTGGETLDPTGDSQKAASDHNMSITGIVRVPDAMKDRFTEPFGVSLTFSKQAQRLCRFGASLFGDGCVSYIDVDTRTAGLRLNTKMRDVQLDFGLNYVNRANYVGTRNGSSQFQLDLRGTFNFEAGAMPQRLVR